MIAFEREVIDGVANEREIELTTFGRKTGQESRRILWAYTDGERIYVRSGGGLDRDWPQNLLANGRGILHVAGINVPVLARHITDVNEARQAGRLAHAKYGESIQVTRDGDEPTLGERATFVLMPV
jgi:deazaflavin-dependent oxidoreductase (nitroreductase family)